MDFEILSRTLKSALNRYTGGIKVSNKVEFVVSFFLLGVDRKIVYTCIILSFKVIIAVSAAVSQRLSLCVTFVAFV